jgi:hypothetical protein
MARVRFNEIRCDSFGTWQVRGNRVQVLLLEKPGYPPRQRDENRVLAGRNIVRSIEAIRRNDVESSVVAAGAACVLGHEHESFRRIAVTEENGPSDPGLGTSGATEVRDFNLRGGDSPSPCRRSEGMARS